MNHWICSLSSKISIEAMVGYVELSMIMYSISKFFVCAVLSQDPS
jgi:hypothetical protein